MRKTVMVLLVALAGSGAPTAVAAAHGQHPPPDNVEVHHQNERYHLSKDQVRELVTGFFFGKPIGAGAGGS